jgi:hypothetical protein
MATIILYLLNWGGKELCKLWSAVLGSWGPGLGTHTTSSWGFQNLGISEPLLAPYFLFPSARGRTKDDGGWYMY